GLVERPSLTIGSELAGARRVSEGGGPPPSLTRRAPGHATLPFGADGLPVSVPIIAMVRPRAGGFCYSKATYQVMLRDAEALLAAGADGLAFGVLHSNGEIDIDRCRQLRQVCGARTAVFHRAFDVTPDPFAALQALIDLGFDRVLTSGQAETA